MNYQLARELYGVTPWFVDQHSLPAMMALLTQFRNGIDLDLPEEKHNSIKILNADLVTISNYRWGELPDNKDFKGIGMINIDGPITKSGGASSYGVSYISNMMLEMAQDDRIIGFICYTDSGGGSSAAVDIFRDAVIEIKKTKPVFGLVQKGGYACSAAYGMLAPCNRIYSEDGMAVVGSAGTMVQFDGMAANTEYKNDGMKHIRVYASKSTKKNQAFEEALNNDNYELLRSEVLDPINDKFLSNMVSDRPVLKGSNFDDGHTVYAKDAVGTFVDGIKSLDLVMKEVESTSKNYNKPEKINKNSSKINNTMTIAELQNLHPELYNSIFNTGVESERNRVGVWMTHIGTNSEKVVAGIKSNKEISPVEREELMVELASKGKLDKIEKDSATEIPTKESTETADKSAEEKELEDAFKGI